MYRSIEQIPPNERQRYGMVQSQTDQSHSTLDQSASLVTLPQLGQKYARELPIRDTKGSNSSKILTKLPFHHRSVCGRPEEKDLFFEESNQSASIANLLQNSPLFMPVEGENSGIKQSKSGRKKETHTNTRLLQQAKSGRYLHNKHQQQLNINSQLANQNSNRYFKSTAAQSQSQLPVPLQEDIGDIRRLMRHRNEQSLDSIVLKYPNRSLHESESDQNLQQVQKSSFLRLHADRQAAAEEENRMCGVNGGMSYEISQFAPQFESVNHPRHPLNENRLYARSRISHINQDQERQGAQRASSHNYHSIDQMQTSHNRQQPLKQQREIIGLQKGKVAGEFTLPSESVSVDVNQTPRSVRFDKNFARMALKQSPIIQRRFEAQGLQKLNLGAAHGQVSGSNNRQDTTTSVFDLNRESSLPSLNNIDISVEDASHRQSIFSQSQDVRKYLLKTPKDVRHSNSSYLKKNLQKSLERQTKKPDRFVPKEEQIMRDSNDYKQSEIFSKLNQEAGENNASRKIIESIGYSLGNKAKQELIKEEALKEKVNFHYNEIMKPDQVILFDYQSSKQLYNAVSDEMVKKQTEKDLREKRRKNMHQIANDAKFKRDNRKRYDQWGYEILPESQQDADEASPKEKQKEQKASIRMTTSQKAKSLKVPLKNHQAKLLTNNASPPDSLSKRSSLKGFAEQDRASSVCSLPQGSQREIEGDVESQLALSKRNSSIGSPSPSRFQGTRDLGAENQPGSATFVGGLPAVPEKVGSINTMLSSRKKSRIAKKKKQKKQAKPQVPNFFDVKGTIDADSLNRRFQDDILTNIGLVEKMGLFSAIKTIQGDALNTIQRQRQTEKLERLYPGYAERFAEVQKKIRKQIFEETKKAEKLREQADGMNNMFSFTPDELTEKLSQLFAAARKQSLQKCTQEKFDEIAEKDEIIAFKSIIRMYQKKALMADTPPVERALSEYIKYLVGEQKNPEFKFKRDDFDQKHELNIKSLKSPFDEYAKQEENSMKTVANDIIERVDFNTIVQKCAEPISIVKFAANPKFNFFKICQQDSDLAIPLLAKVVNRQLSLLNYKLSVGHVRAFCKTFDFNKEFVSRFLFQNCGMTDEHNAFLFTHMQKLNHVSSIVLKNEDFGQKSVDALTALLERPAPLNLMGFRLINCRTSVNISRQLIQKIKECNQLKVLGLVNAKISDDSMQELGLVLQESSRIQDLDISWNILKQSSYNNLIIGLRENKTLTSVNLSWNRIVDKIETKIVEDNQPQTGKTPQKTEQNTARSGGAQPQNQNQANNQDLTGEMVDFEQQQPWHEQQIEFSPQSTLVIDSLCQLIKRNKRLQHLNLASTGLTEFMILRLVKAMRRAKSLASVHLCNNPGVTQRVIDHCQEMLRCVPRKQLTQKVFKVQEFLFQTQHTTAHQILQKQLSQEKEEIGEKAVARETIKIKQIMERKRIHSLVNDFAEDSSNQNRMIFNRILGHKPEMPGSGQWRLVTDNSEDCWICNQDVYGLVFFDQKHIGKKASLSTENQNQQPIMNTVLEKLWKLTPKLLEDQKAEENPRVPIIYGNFTNWEPKLMTEITDFSEIFEQQYNFEDVLSKLHLDKKVPYKINDQSEFNRQHTVHFEAYKRKYWSEWVQSGWKTVLQRNLLFKKPHLIFAAETRPDFHKTLFTLAAMFKAGRQEFVIRSPIIRPNTETYEDEKVNPEYYFFTNVSDIRAEEVHPFIKQSKKNSNQRRFDKEKSVFAPWREDSDILLQDTLGVDSTQWKLQAAYKDPTVYKPIVAIMRANFAFVKDLFIDVLGNSVSYPFINKVELVSWLEKCGLMDEKLNTSQADLQYVSTVHQSYEGVKNKSGLMRHEFLEFLVRVSKVKYFDTGKVGSISEALRKLLMTIRSNYSTDSWQQFRDQELWTVEVNDVFTVNLDGCKAIHAFYMTPTQKYMSFKDAIQLMTKDTALALTQKQARYCLTFCKMTIVNEKTDFERHTRLAFVEMLEMIGRMAKVKFQGTDFGDEPLEKRIEHVLDLILPLVKYRRKEVPAEPESESESDDDY